MARDRDELDPREDPTRITNQPSLTTSSGRAWYILGGLLAVISVATLFWLRDTGPAGIVWFGIVAVVVLYAVMLATPLATAPGRRRLGVLAIAMLAMAAIALGCVIAIMLAIPVGDR